jgi:hypothetical protein
LGEFHRDVAPQNGTSDCNGGVTQTWRGVHSVPWIFAAVDFLRATMIPKMTPIGKPYSNLAIGNHG